MVRQETNREVQTGTVEETSRYFHYLRTLADITAMASIMAVQVQALTQNFFCESLIYNWYSYSDHYLREVNTSEFNGKKIPIHNVYVRIETLTFESKQQHKWLTTKKHEMRP